MELSDTQSSMCIAGEEPMIYDGPGSFIAFDSEFWHRSGRSYPGTIKLALFFELNMIEVLDVEDDAPKDADPGGSSKMEEEVIGRSCSVLFGGACGSRDGQYLFLSLSGGIGAGDVVFLLSARMRPSLFTVAGARDSNWCGGKGRQLCKSSTTAKAFSVEM